MFRVRARFERLASGGGTLNVALGFDVRSQNSPPSWANLFQLVGVIALQIYNRMAVLQLHGEYSDNFISSSLVDFQLLLMSVALWS